jgi:hypothetical protein
MFRKYNLNISSQETKAVAYAGVEPVTAEVIVDGKTIEN